MIFFRIHISGTKTSNPKHTKKWVFRVYISDTKTINPKHTKKRFYTKKRFLNKHVSDRKTKNLKHTKKWFLRWRKCFKEVSVHIKRKRHNETSRKTNGNANATFSVLGQCEHIFVSSVGNENEMFSLLRSLSFMWVGMKDN